MPRRIPNVGSIPPPPSSLVAPPPPATAPQAPIVTPPPSAVDAPQGYTPPPPPLPTPPIAMNGQPPVAPPVPPAPPVQTAAQFVPPSSPAAPPPFNPAAMMNIPSPGSSSSDDFNFGAIDLSGIEISNFRILDPLLEYEFEIEKAAIETSEEKGNKMVKLDLIVTFPEEYEGAKVWDYCSTAEKALWKLKSLAAACDLLNEDGSRIVATSVSEFVGNIVRAKVINVEYSGRIGSKIDGGYMIATETPGIS